MKSKAQWIQSPIPCSHLVLGSGRKWLAWAKAVGLVILYLRLIIIGHCLVNVSSFLYVCIFLSVSCNIHEYLYFLFCSTFFLYSIVLAIIYEARICLFPTWGVFQALFFLVLIRNKHQNNV